MPVTAVIGAQWGDEGKGKIVDLLAEQADVVARYSGGDNAGHTVVNALGEFRLHLVPSGVFNPRCLCMLGNGVAINPDILLGEIDRLRERGVSVDRLLVSERAHVIMPYHVQFDRLEEERRGARAIGTTGKGIGPCFVDKVGRAGVRIGDLLDPAALRERLEANLQAKNLLLSKVYGAEPLDFAELFNTGQRWAERLRPHVADTAGIIDRRRRQGERILLEGAQGSLLDPDFGTYPYVTSSSPLAANACLGTGLAPTSLERVIGVFKAYSTRVGHGPMPTELLDATGELIRERGREYGTTTGRARRCGWFDAVVGRFTNQINGFTSLAITRLDILDALPSLKICTAYRAGGEHLEVFPANPRLLADCQPVYEEFPGWQQDTSHWTRLSDLPRPARAYVDRLAELVGAPVEIISVGPGREQTIVAR